MPAVSSEDGIDAALAATATVQDATPQCLSLPHRESAESLFNELADTRNAVGAVVGRADSKSSTLLGLVGLALGAAITILAAASGGHQTLARATGLAIGWAATLLLTGSVILLIIAVRPVMSVYPPLRDWISSVEGELLLIEDAAASPPNRESGSVRNRQQVAYIVSLTALVYRKHRLMKLAADLLLFAIPLFVLAAVVYAIAG